LDCGVFSAAFVGGSGWNVTPWFCGQKAAINRTHSKRWRDVRVAGAVIPCRGGRVVCPIGISDFGFVSDLGFRTSDL
jgi:hypothetical protein